MKHAAIFLLAMGLAIPASASNASILSWYPEVHDYISVNDTVTYRIATAHPMVVNNWSVDGQQVTGSDSYTRTWDSSGFHTVTYRGSNSGTEVEFRWYVNVGHQGGSIFDIIDDALENHAADLKISMFRYRIANGADANIAEQKVNQMQEEIERRQMTLEHLVWDFRSGNITVEEYVATLKRVQRDSKYTRKLAKEMAKIAKEGLKDEKSGRELETISEMEDDNGEEKIRGYEGNNSKNRANKGKNDRKR